MIVNVGRNEVVLIFFWEIENDFFRNVRIVGIYRGFGGIFG